MFDCSGHPPNFDISPLAGSRNDWTATSLSRWTLRGQMEAKLAAPNLVGAIEAEMDARI